MNACTPRKSPLWVDVCLRFLAVNIMANGTTTVEEEEFKPPLPERVGEERGSLTGLAQELVYTVDHKKLGLMYIGSGLLFFVVGGIMATLIRVQLFSRTTNFSNRTSSTASLRCTAQP
jgi:hypothetical protein